MNSEIDRLTEVVKRLFELQVVDQGLVMSRIGFYAAGSSAFGADFLRLRDLRPFAEVRRAMKANPQWDVGSSFQQFVPILYGDEALTIEVGSKTFLSGPTFQRCIARIQFMLDTVTKVSNSSIETLTGCIFEISDGTLSIDMSEMEPWGVMAEESDQSEDEDEADEYMEEKCGLLNAALRNLI